VSLRVLLPAFLFKLPTANNKNFELARKKVLHFITTIVGTRARNYKADPNKGDLLNLMLKADESGEKLSEEEILNEIILFLAAGHETTANTLSWTFFLLAKYPEWQEKLRAEIDALYGKEDPSFDDINKLKLGTYIIKETLRLYPTAPILTRDCCKDSTVLGYNIPAGTTCMMSVSNISRNEQYWDNPNEFNPMRFDNDTWQKHPYQYLPFGTGAQRCIGEKFAVLEMKVTLIKLVQKFTWKFESVEDMNVTGIFTITYGPKDGNSYAINSYILVFNICCPRCFNLITIS